MKVKLIKLTKDYQVKLGEMIDEWKLDQAMNHTNISPWSIFKNDYHDFDHYLNHLEIKLKQKIVFLIQCSFCLMKKETGYWER